MPTSDALAPRQSIYGTPNDNARHLKRHTVSFRIRQFRGTGEHQAFLCKQSGTLYWQSEFTGDLDELPDDIDDRDKYVQIPDKRELELGKPLALDFAREFLPDEVGDVQEIFSKRGAYARFKDLLQRRGDSINGTISKRMRRKER